MDFESPGKTGECVTGLGNPLTVVDDEAESRGHSKKGELVAGLGWGTEWLCVCSCSLRRLPEPGWLLARGSCQGSMGAPPHYAKAFHLLIIPAVLALPAQSAPRALARQELKVLDRGQEWLGTRPSLHLSNGSAVVSLSPLMTGSVALL